MPILIQKHSGLINIDAMFKRTFLCTYVCIFPCCKQNSVRPLSTYLSTYFLNDLSSFLVFCSLITIFPSQRMVMAKCCGTYFKSGLFLSIEISGHVLKSFHRWGQTNYEIYIGVFYLHVLDFPLVY